MRPITVEETTARQRRALQGQVAERLRIECQRAGLIEIPRDELTDHGRRFVANAAGILFRITGADVESMHRDELASVADAFFVSVDDRIVLLEKPKAGPRTVQEIEERQAAQERLVSEAQERADRHIRSTPVRPLTLADVRGVNLPTLRRAAEIVLEYGSIVAAGDSLRFDLHEAVMTDAGYLDAVEVLLAGRAVVLDALASKNPDLSKLPDEQVLAGGGVAAR